MSAVIYTKTHCPYCTRAKALMDSRGIVYQELIIGVADPQSLKLKPNQQLCTREQLLSAYPDAKTVPQIWLHGTHIGGYDHLVAHLSAE